MRKYNINYIIFQQIMLQIINKIRNFAKLKIFLTMINKKDKATGLDNLIPGYIDILKSGGSIHIKKKNRGKFTESAKRAGKSVQQHAKDVLNDPNATALQKKRANFARNAAKWNKK